MIQPGLERIGLLLKHVQFPWKSIHVAGTNGKGSICLLASTFLRRKNIPVGTFTSPYTIDRWDCISINGEPVKEHNFRRVENHFKILNERDKINASEFEILTATAFEMFNNAKIKVGVVEVGMGGKLDATNILNNQVVSVISKIAHDHQSFLGTTLPAIAHHKAGILRPSVPYIVNPVNEFAVQDVIDAHAKEIGAGPRLSVDTPSLRQELFSTIYWQKFAEGKMPWQRDNAVLAYLAVRKYCEVTNESTARLREMLSKMNKLTLPGRQQMQTVPPVFGNPRARILVDGAHNRDASEALSSYVFKHFRARRRNSNTVHYPENGWPITWVVAMSEGRDPRSFLFPLLQPGDNIIATTFGPVDGMPWVKPMDPQAILKAAKECTFPITRLCIPVRGAMRALCAAKYLAKEEETVIVLTGSLYFVSELLREKQQFKSDPGFLNMTLIDREERFRVNDFLSAKSLDDPVGKNRQQHVDDISKAERRNLEQSIEQLNWELERLGQEEKDIHYKGLQEREEAAMVDGSPVPGLSPPPTASENSGVSVKQKFFSEFEGIRRKLENLPGHGPVSNFPKGDLRGLLNKEQSRHTLGDLSTATTSQPTIRAHLSLSKQDERPAIDRLSDQERMEIGKMLSANSTRSPPQTNNHTDAVAEDPRPFADRFHDPDPKHYTDYPKLDAKTVDFSMLRIRKHLSFPDPTRVWDTDVDPAFSGLRIRKHLANAGDVDFDRGTAEDPFSVDPFSVVRKQMAGSPHYEDAVTVAHRKYDGPPRIAAPPRIAPPAPHADGNRRTRREVLREQMQERRELMRKARSKRARALRLPRRL
ncbi:hypothetical protein BDV95DRAFT_570121 [Massariosphaeria phaeospora]|uniref:Mur ligase central domain-containing protein n=1 Tax=Massariosphaeria phaeospora TaxID=100035 RepID=A0A7C8MBA5_9PLEO|nr:hypothetical protein BDV95DRAFT_570121 [Massariosphaeria phaeospora]